MGCFAWGVDYWLCFWKMYRRTQIHCTPSYGIFMAFFLLLLFIYCHRVLHSLPPSSRLTDSTSRGLNHLIDILPRELSWWASLRFAYNPPVKVRSRNRDVAFKPSLPLRTHKGHETKGGGNFDVRREGLWGLHGGDHMSGGYGDNGSSR